MKIFINVILVILMFLAISSGVSKVLLMPQDVEFFGRYGFTNSILIAYGVVQLMGGIFLVPSKTRIIGAFVLAITFLISLVFLLMSGNITVAIVTLVCIALLGIIIKQSFIARNTQPNANSA